MVLGLFGFDKWNPGVLWSISTGGARHWHAGGEDLQGLPRGFAFEEDGGSLLGGELGGFHLWAIPEIGLSV